MFYTGVDGKREQGCLCVAAGPDLAHLTKQKVAAQGARGRRQHQGSDRRAGADGRWRLFFEYARDNASRIGLALADDPRGPWQVAADPFTVREDLWDTWHLSTGPILAREGQPPVMFYNGATADARWRIGWIAFDENFTRVVDRCIEPLLVPPPPKERAGTDIAFAASCLDRGRDILLYFSLEDRLLRRAVVRQLRSGVSANVNRFGRRRLTRIGAIGVLTPVDMWKITLQSREFVVNTVPGGHRLDVASLQRLPPVETLGEDRLRRDGPGSLSPLLRHEPRAVPVPRRATPSGRCSPSSRARMPKQLNDALGRIGFRRSQTVAYRPSCLDCRACVSVRVAAGEFQPSTDAAPQPAAQRRPRGHRMPPVGDLASSSICCSATSASATPAAAWRRWTRSITPTWWNIPPVSSFVLEYREPSVNGDAGPPGRRLPHRSAGRRVVDDLQLLRPGT